jgi:trimeric autotransporter adhesin
MAYQRYIGRDYTAGNVTPSSNGAVSLGQPQKRWKEVYVDANSLHLGNVSFSIGKTNQLELMRTDKLGHPVANVVLANAVAKPIIVMDGGTGASTFTDGGVLLGSGAGAITAMSVLTDGQMIVGDGTTDPVAESGATLRTSIGVGTGDSPQFTAVNIGAATDTTVARASAGDINVEGNLIYRAGGTDVPVSDGGTGASSFTDGHVLLGSGTGAITALNVTAKGSILAGDGTTDPVALGVGDNDQVLTADSGEASGLKWAAAGSTVANRSITQAKLAENSVGGSKVRANVLTGGQIIGSVVGFQSNVTGNVSVSRSLAVGYVDGRVPQANLEVKGNAHITGATTIAGALTLGTDLAVAQGGTGASTFTDGGVLLGSGTGAITALAVLTDGQMIVGDGTTDPVAESGATLRTSIGVGTSDDVEFADVKSTGVILAADGAVDAPSITNTGDLDTGIWYPAADTIAISTGGAEALRISGVGQNATVSSHVVNHKGLATSNYTEYANNIINAGSSFTVSTGTNIARYTLNVATCAITLPAGQPIQPGTMKTIILFLKQDGTGGRVVNFNAPSGETLEWNNSASEPEAVTGASKVSIYTFMKFHGDTRWYCSQSFIEN